MADNESDLETFGLQLALDTLRLKHCCQGASLNSKSYCSEFCELVEEYTGQWQVPLPQLKVLRTALCSFTSAAVVFPDDCQHIQYVLSSLALSFFELMLFFSKEEFVEEPLKGILNSFQECHSHLYKHRNIYLQHVKQIIKGGGPWENRILQGILKKVKLPQNEVEDYLSSELPIFLELRVRYLQACERLQEAMTLAKSCLENPKAGMHQYFHQAYLTCLYKASLYENLHKEMKEIDGRDAVEIICNTESVEKDELLLSLCKTFLTQQLHNGDMYYIWDLVFIWSKLYLRAHPSKQSFLAECLHLASSATNVRAIFPFIKLVTTELGNEGVEVCVELCARALQLCDKQADTLTQSLICKTIAFLLPHDLEICRACALLVFCQERNLETYRTVCLLYTHPDQEPHPHSSALRTNVRFHILQILKERLCFDPEFWNLLTLRTHCLELLSDKVTKDVVLSEMKEEEEKEYAQEMLPNNCAHSSCILGLKSCHCTPEANLNQDVSHEREQRANGAEKEVKPKDTPLKRVKWGRRLRKRTKPLLDDDLDLDPEMKCVIKSVPRKNKPVYYLRQNHTKIENSAGAKIPLNRKREYLSRCVKSQILKRKGRKRRWLQGLPWLEQAQTVKEKKVIVLGKKRGRKPLLRLELSYPDNEIYFQTESCEEETSDNSQESLYLDDENRNSQRENEHLHNLERGNRDHPLLISSDSSNQVQEEPQSDFDSSSICADPQVTASLMDGSAELDGPLLELLECPVQEFHNYTQRDDSENAELSEVNGEAEQDEQSEEEEEMRRPRPKVKAHITWREKIRRSQKYSHLTYYCKFCSKAYKGLNVMRHAVSHLKNRKLICIFCGKYFRQFFRAKKHVLDHIDEMRKQKPPEKPAKTNAELDANGNTDTTDNQSEKTAPPAKTEVPVQKPKSKSKKLNLTREERILRNTRILTRKFCPANKRHKGPGSEPPKQVQYKDEQVVITKDTVIIRGPFLIQNKEEEGGGESEIPAEENGCGHNIIYHLCPSESCDKVFVRISSTMTKHALKWHVDDDKVLENTFVWSKRKCILCYRQLHYLQHYKDHMKLHGSTLRFFCYHMNCSQRFSTKPELRDHVRTHDPFRPQCSFPECQQLFSNFQGLYDHEWRHYVPTPQKEELDTAPKKTVEPSAEAPWKQRVKVEELWLQSRKVESESPAPDLHADGGEVRKEAAEITPLDSASTSEFVLCLEPVEEVTPVINGCEDQMERTENKPASQPNTEAGAPQKKNKNKKKVPDEWDVINVKKCDDNSTLEEGIQKNIGEPHITEHKSFKPEDPAYQTFIKAPFIRPPPSTYLNEKVLSMPKRRSSEAPEKPIKVYAVKRKKKKAAPQVPPPEVKPAPAPELKIRHRCDKCLSSFNTAEELQRHRILNTCSSLFGFDSDDES